MKRLMVVLFAGLLVLSACGGDDGDDSSDTTVEATTTTEEVEVLALDEWIEEADDICAEADEALDELPEVETIEELIDQAPDALEALEEQHEQLVALGLPDEMADEAEEALGLLEEQLALIEQLVDAGPGSEAEDLLVEGQELSDEADALAAEIGLEVCGASDDTTDDTTDDDTTDTTLSADQGMTELLAAGLGDLGLTADESTCVSNGMLDRYSVTELAELDPEDSDVQGVIVEILFSCVTPERIAELNLQ